jgi:hypothetical protein
MNEQTPVADISDEVPPPICFSFAKRAVSDALGDAQPVPTEPGRRDAASGRVVAEIEARIERLAERFDQLEFVILEQFESGMTPNDGSPAGSLCDRLDRIEAALAHVAQAADRIAATDETETATARQLDAMAARVGDLLQAQAQVVTSAEDTAARLADLLRAVVEAESHGDARHVAVLGALDRIASRPAPAPDLTIQHRSFAGFATALQAALGRYDASAQGIAQGLDVVAGRLDAVEVAFRRERAEPSAAAPQPPAGLEAALGLLCDRIGALVEVHATGPQMGGVPELASVATRLDLLAGMLSTSLEDARGRGVPIEDTLRDLRMAVAEIAAENRRLRIE